MEPNNTPQPPASTEIPIPMKPQADLSKDKVKVFVENLKTKFNALPKNTRTMVVVAGVLFGIIFILLILSILFGKKKNTAPVSTPTPAVVSVTPGPVVITESRYATDSGVLKIESDLNGFAAQLNSTNVKQTDLNVPNLDFNISFGQ